MIEQANFLTTVSLSSVSNTQHNNLFFSMINLVDNPVITLANAPAIFAVTQLFSVNRTRIFKRSKCTPYTGLHFRRELTKITPGRGRKKNIVLHCL